MLRYNKTINAVVTINEHLLEEARQLDQLFLQVCISFSQAHFLLPFSSLSPLPSLLFSSSPISHFQNGVTGPLHGLPVIIKDCFATKGIRTTCGSPSLKVIPPFPFPLSSFSFFKPLRHPSSPLFAFLRPHLPLPLFLSSSLRLPPVLSSYVLLFMFIYRTTYPHMTQKLCTY